jgi:uncharacterized protein YxjI
MEKNNSTLSVESSGHIRWRRLIFNRGSGQVAAVSKQWFSWTDSYGVDIAEGEDDLLILAATVVIDMACHEKDL